MFFVCPSKPRNMLDTTYSLNKAANIVISRPRSCDSIGCT